MDTKVLAATVAVFDLPLKNISIRPFGSGLINDTWLIDNLEGRAQCFLLQRINHRAEGRLISKILARFYLLPCGTFVKQLNLQNLNYG
jgi:hypothetical protein